MTQTYRLDNIGYINRDKKISFKFNGKNISVTRVIH
jgi:sarcosine oxidase subunit alpha